MTDLKTIAICAAIGFALAWIRGRFDPVLKRAREKASR